MRQRFFPRARGNLQRKKTQRRRAPPGFLTTLI